jgi:hypothetical protein
VDAQTVHSQTVVSQSVRDARDAYFAANKFSDATYSDAWVKLRVGPIPFAFPNSRSRKRAIPLHDLHHVATGYTTSLVGEAEIGAWEIGGGCTNYWAAWVLNAIAFGWGLALAPRRTFRAFVRGRHARTLYRDGWDDHLLVLTVVELRAKLGLAGARDGAPATLGDVATFAGWVALVLAPGAIAGGLAIAALV